MKVKSESEVTQLCPALSDPMDCSLTVSSIHGMFQARALEWVAIAFSGNTGDPGSIPGLGRSPEEGVSYPLQYSGLENSIDCIVHGVAESDMTERLSLVDLLLCVNFCCTAERVSV